MTESFRFGLISARREGMSCRLTGSMIGVEYKKNPFLYFYHPDNLIDVVYRMGGASSADAW